MINPKFIVIAISAVVVMGGLQQIRVYHVQRQLSECKQTYSEQRADYMEAKAAAAGRAAALLQEVEDLRTEVARQRLSRELEVLQRVEQAERAANAARSEYERRLRGANQGCIAWQQEAVPCPVQ